VNIAIALAGLPDTLDGSLRDAIGDLRHDPAIDIVAEHADTIDALLAPLLHRLDAIVMVMPTTDTLPAGIDQLLGEYQGLTVIAVTRDGNQALVYEGSLADALRRRVQPRSNMSWQQQQEEGSWLRSPCQEL
jgi:hypothetical protein